MERQSKLETVKKPNSGSGMPSGSRKLIILVVVLVVVIIAILLLGRLVQNGGSGKYEDTNTKATASFEADLDFKRNCKDQKDCDANKPSYDNVKMFVFDDQGMQVRVVRADKDGVFKASLPEGNYILVTAKTFESQKGLPQETVSLKNGKLLKLELDYGTEIAQKKQ